MRVDDPLREPGRARRVVELGGIVRRRVRADEVGRRRGRASSSSITSVSGAHGRSKRGAFSASVTRRRASRVGEPMLDPVVAVEHRHREQDRAELPDAEEDRRRLGRRRQDDGDAVATGHAPRGERVGRLVREILELAPVELARPSRRSSPTPSRACRADACRRRRRRCCSARARPSGGRHTSPRSSGCSSARGSSHAGAPCEAPLRPSFSLGR